MTPAPIDGDLIFLGMICMAGSMLTSLALAYLILGSF